MDTAYSVLDNDETDDDNVDQSEPAILEQTTEQPEDKQQPEIDDFDSDGDLATGDAKREHSSFIAEKETGHIMYVKTPKIVFFLVFFAGIGQFLAGYHVGLIATVMLVIREEFGGLDHQWQAAVVSAAVASAACFAFIGYFMNQSLGRKYTSLLAAMFYTVGAIILGIAWDRWIILIGRVVVGCGLGISSVTLSPYIRECVTSRMRVHVQPLEIAVSATGVLVANVVGSALSYNTDFGWRLVHATGVLMANIVGSALSYNTDFGWRIMTGVTGLPSFAMLMGMLFMPESPEWLVRSGNEDKARRVLMKLRGSCDVMDEMDKLHANVKGDKSDDKLKGMRLVREMWGSRRSLFVGSCLHMFKQLTGYNVILHYSGSVIAMAGIRDITLCMWLSTAIAAVNAFFTLVSIAISNKVTKKTLTLGSYIGVFISLVVLALSYELDVISTPAVSVGEVGRLNSSCSMYRTCESCSLADGCGFCHIPTPSGLDENSCEPAPIYGPYSTEGRCATPARPNNTELWTAGLCPTPFYWISIIGMAQYVAFYGFGLSTTTRAINDELYPETTRSLGLGLSTATNWLFTFLVTLTFPSLIRIITKYGVFWLYAGCSFVGILFVLFGVPQTDDRPKKSVAWKDPVKDEGQDQGHAKVIEYRD